MMPEVRGQLRVVTEPLFGLQIGAQCVDCGFEYRAYHGHLEPCPRCAIQRILRVITPCVIESWRLREADLSALLDLNRDLRDSYPARV